MTSNDPAERLRSAIAMLRKSVERAGAMPAPPAPPTPPPLPEAPSLDGYTRLGPGPLGVIRLRWTIRAVGAESYVVDETVGSRGTAVTSAPMPREAALRYVEEREQAARQRFDDLRAELAWPGPTDTEPDRDAPQDPREAASSIAPETAASMTPPPERES